MRQQEQIQKKALLVEDDQITKRVYSAQLNNLGYEVDAAEDALSAINKLREKAYCLIVTDLRLPDKPGSEVIKAARQSKLNQGSPLIVSSAQLSQSDFKKYYSQGADAVLIKPYCSQILEHTIKDCHLRPNYQRKFFYQIKTGLEAFEENMKQLQGKEYSEIWLEHFQTLLAKNLDAIREYRQWIAFEKSKVKGQRKW